MKKKFPAQIKYIVGNEAAERFSFYGMRSILFIFMVQYLGMDEQIATSKYHLFVSACYLTPLLGGWISDRFLGKYRTILYLSIVYCLGHLALAIDESETGLYIGLALIALGSGGIKPCVSAHVGDQFDETTQELLPKVFDLFYFSINFGSAFSFMLIPWVLPVWGPSVAFGIPGILMAIATFVFWMGRHYYVHVPPTGKTSEPSVLYVYARTMGAHLSGKGEDNFWKTAKRDFGHTDADGAEALWGIAKVFFFISVFWALFDQQGSTWVAQAQIMDQELWGFTVLPAQMQSLNPFMVMVLIPFFSLVVYPWLNKKGLKVTPLRKMGTGMLLAGVSFLSVGVLQNVLDSGVHVHILWQSIPYLILTASEVMVSITGLEFAYTQAPRSKKSQVMSIYFLTVVFGNLLAAYVAQLNPFDGNAALDFHFYGVLTLVVSLGFIQIARHYRERNYIEKKGAY